MEQRFKQICLALNKYNESLPEFVPTETVVGRWTLTDIDPENFKWHDKDTKKPTIAELDALLELDKVHKLRAAYYPPLSELADAIYHKENGDGTKLDSYLDKVRSVKIKFPKI
jgi:hypothetical protein